MAYDRLEVLYGLMDKVYRYESPEKIKNVLEEYELKYNDDVYILSQILMFEMDTFWKELDKNKFLNKLNRVDTQWHSYANNVFTGLSSDEYRMWADLKLRIVKFIPPINIAKRMKIAKESKRLYKLSLSLDEDNVWTNISLGVWSFFAPIVAGGGPKLAENYFSKGLELSKTDAEKFNAYRWLSQVFFQSKDEARYQKNITEMLKIYGNNIYTEEVLELNKQGKSLGEEE